ncbi:hypothetical protein HY025_04960 [Candidatus Daviesbacteria bacterium]|nr:hypothetical protein [Candidatus Daviesbacteria bacterium]
MIAFGHTGAGASIGLLGYSLYKDSNPILGLGYTAGLGIISHYILDFVPHGHFVKPAKLHKYLIPILVGDVFLSVLIFLGADFLKEGLTLRFLYILFGIGGSLLPDIVDGLMEIKYLPRNLLFKIEYGFHKGLHWHGKDGKTRLLDFIDIWQIALILYSLFLMLKT